MKFKIQVIDGYLVKATNNNRLYVKVISPHINEYPGQKFPTVVNYPGGLGCGENFDLKLAEEGYIEVHFNPVGRVGKEIDHPSEGDENHNGFVHQDDLKNVINWIASKSNVQVDNIGVYSRSFGITAAAGCLGRYPDLPVKFLIDSEGPHNSFASACEAWLLDDNPANNKRTYDAWDMLDGHKSTQKDPSEANKQWWYEREAIRYIGNISCAYLRLQGIYDHAQPPRNEDEVQDFDLYPDYFQNMHAIEMNNKAVEGSALWSRINLEKQGNPPNTKFSYDNPPVYVDGKGEVKLIANKALKYMFNQRF